MFALVEKGLHLSSFTAIAKLRKVFQTKTIGHTGTLDPLATGLLIVATDRSTKLLPYLDDLEKTYLFEVDFSLSSPSWDLGTPTERISETAFESGSRLQKADLEKCIQTHFIGKILQVPPVYSAVKVNGKRAYHLAREGKEATLGAREITVHRFEVVDFTFPVASFRAVVSTGSYIRSLARDIGEQFGLGGTVTKLRRERIGSFEAPGSTESPQIVEEQEFFKWRIEQISENEYNDIKNGIRIQNRFARVIDEPFMASYNSAIVSILAITEDGTCQILRNIR